MGWVVAKVCFVGLVGINEESKLLFWVPPVFTQEFSITGRDTHDRESRPP
jgi:hypothetical protein